MPKKYHVEIKPAPPRYSPVPKYSYFEIDRCLGCRRCVKYTACIYDVHSRRAFEAEQMVDTGDNLCVNCFRCLQECKNNIMSRAINPRYQRLGNHYWTPDIVSRIWSQAETGKIPVSGAGYRGPFTGPGFDSMWTDMSEIVRPTRDGIHGREYISTMVELGRKLPHLTFNENNELEKVPPPLQRISIPVLLDIPHFGRHMTETARRAMARGAADLETLAVAEYAEATSFLEDHKPNLVIKLDPEKQDLKGLAGAPAAELPFSDNVVKHLENIQAEHPGMVLSVRLPLDSLASDRAVELTRKGAGVLHLCAGPNGEGQNGKGDVFIIDLVREVHNALVDNSLREEVSVIAGGGIAMAEHMAKIIICGADAAAVELAPLAALECRLCRDCEEQATCPVRIDLVPEKWGAQRIVNLLGAWHSQLIEVMGAMGMREVRRLRGEVGRAMFFADLERENFAPLFGERKEPRLSSGNPGLDAAARQEVKTPMPSPSAKEPFKSRDGELPAKECPSRYRNRLSRYEVIITSNCNQCGECVDACKYDVFEATGGYLLSPRAFRCVGEERCRSEGSLCTNVCPEDAIRIGPNPLWQTFGDPRWTADMIVSTWRQAETGYPPEGAGIEYKTGNSGGGFDRIDFIFPDQPPDPDLKPEETDLRIPLNRRKDSKRPEVEIGFPVYGGGMSFGSISLTTMLSRARAYEAFESFTCTGEGGYPDELTEYDDAVITQVATGLFGVREETIQRVRMVEFKYAQGAKPGLGGHLLGDKVTPAVARMREAVEGSALFSPFPFHSVYSVEDHKKHVDWIKEINKKALVSVKVSTPTDVDMVAVGSYYAGAHIVHIDGSYGGTGAAPDIAKKNIAMPIEYAINKVHQFLVEEGVRDQMTLVASGGIRTAWDIAKAIALGADGVVIGTAEMVALECIRCGNCESGRGCPRGIATTDPELSSAYSTEWATQRLVNLFHSYALQLQEILWRLGMKSVKELVGRTDVLCHRDYEKNG
ncbi:MAG: glutamate synthase-related protein [bacterium]